MTLKISDKKTVNFPVDSDCARGVVKSSKSGTDIHVIKTAPNEGSREFNKVLNIYLVQLNRHARAFINGLL